MTQYAATKTNPPVVPTKLVDLKQLDKRCSMSFDDYCTEALANGGEVVYCPDGQRYIFYNRGGKLLATGHLDVVFRSKHREAYKPYKNRPLRYYAVELDDRMGAYILLDVLPALGINDYDILLTEGEESGRSSAKWFEPPTEDRYNWVFEFDRAGTDVVMYDYEDDAMLDLLNAYNFHVGWGAFSDICSLEHLWVKAFNFGCGYYLQHTNNCYCVPKDVKSIIRKFAKFWLDQKDTKLAHDPEAQVQYGYYDHYDDDLLEPVDMTKIMPRKSYKKKAKKKASSWTGNRQTGFLKDDPRTEEERLSDSLQALEEADKLWESDRLHEIDPRAFDYLEGDVCQYEGTEYYYSAVKDSWEPIRDMF